MPSCPAWFALEGKRHLRWRAAPLKTSRPCHSRCLAPGCHSGRCGLRAGSVVVAHQAVLEAVAAVGLLRDEDAAFRLRGGGYNAAERASADRERTGSPLQFPQVDQHHRQPAEAGPARLPRHWPDALLRPLPARAGAARRGVDGAYRPASPASDASGWVPEGMA